MAVATECNSTNLSIFYTWNTRKDEVMCLHVSREMNILTGHESNMMIWFLDLPSKNLSLKGSVIPPVKGSVTCICQFPHTPALALSVDNNILIYQYSVTNGVIASLSLKEQFCFNREEINQIDIHSKGSFICACDDGGEVKVIDMENKKLLRTLSQLHDSICSTVKFSIRKPWEILSGGLDCTVGRWDFNRGRLLANLSTGSSSSSSMYMVNPPMVHSLDVFSKHHSIVCGLGDGRLAIYSLKSPKGIDFVCESRPHLSSVACVHCVENERSGSLVVSIGNDEVLCVSKLVGHDRSNLMLVAKRASIPKVNWVDVLCGSNVLIFTADVSGTVSIYSFS